MCSKRDPELVALRADGLREGPLVGGYTVLVGELGWLGIVWSTAVVSSPADSVGNNCQQLS